MPTWTAFLSALEPLTTPLPHLVLAFSTIPLLISLACGKRNSVCIVPESLMFQSLAALSRYSDVWTSFSPVTLLQVAQVLLPVVTAWWIVRLQKQICAIQEDQDIEPLLENKPNMKASSTTTPLSIQWKFMAISMLAIFALLIFIPYPLTYTASLFYTLTILSTCLDFIQPFPQHIRVLSLYGIGPPEKLEQSQIRQVLTQAELERPKVPRGVWCWLILYPLGVLARLPQLGLEVVKAQGEEVAARIMPLAFETTAFTLLPIFLAFLRCGPRVVRKSAIE
ncbi:uncharacterized protein SPSC_06122 [Sporisorium scitamineum]|uniref:Uncharacterized protein n=1 Tax=Sporisorium scitamineum TaxID=49012 RepID=A0A127ZIL3_9BASI|nr:uncharacterized protein SPSC_06122 [Sporisorium scitamineum]